MSRKTLTFAAIAISILYGAGFAVFDGSRSTYAVIGGAVVAIAWIAVGYLAKADETACATGGAAGPDLRISRSRR